MSEVLGARRADARETTRPLSEREKALIQRLLSDPYVYPSAFKSWHVRSLEMSDLSLPMTNVTGLTTTLGLDLGSTGTVALLNTGTVILFAGTGVPPDSLLCDGGVYDRTVYPELFDVIGTTYGGAGSTFNVPNIAGPVAGVKYVIVT